MSHFRDIFKSTTFSFEFFPPKSEQGAQTLFDHIVKLEALGPSFVSVTYGAGGSTRTLTRDLVHRVVQETGTRTVPHLTCVKHSEDEIRSIVEGYAKRGIQSILALRGDAPKDEDHNFANDRFAAIKPARINTQEDAKKFTLRSKFEIKAASLTRISRCSKRFIQLIL